MSHDKSTVPKVKTGAVNLPLHLQREVGFPANSKFGKKSGSTPVLPRSNLDDALAGSSPLSTSTEKKAITEKKMSADKKSSLAADGAQSSEQAPKDGAKRINPTNDSHPKKKKRVQNASDIVASEVESELGDKVDKGEVPPNLVTDQTAENLLRSSIAPSPANPQEGNPNVTALDITPVAWDTVKDGVIKSGELFVTLPKEQRTPSRPTSTSLGLKEPLEFPDEYLALASSQGHLIRLYERRVKELRLRLREAESSVEAKAMEKLKAISLQLKVEEGKVDELSADLVKERGRVDALENMVANFNKEKDARDALLSKEISHLRRYKRRDIVNCERATAEVGCYRAVVAKVDAYLVGRSEKQKAEEALNRTLGALDCLKALRDGRDKEEYELELLAAEAERRKSMTASSSLSLERSDLVVPLAAIEERLKAVNAEEEES